MKYLLVPLIMALLIAPHQASAASALGQLESDSWAGRSINTVKVPMPGRPQMVPSTSTTTKGVLSGAAAAGKASSALGALSMGLQILDILDALDSPPEVDNTQQLLEQQRQEQERLQNLRQQSAEQLRSRWDRADSEHAASLDGMLDVPVQGGTAFFGIAPNPSGVVLPGQPAVTAAPPASATPAPAPAPVAPAPRNHRSPQQTAATMQEMPQLTTELYPAHTEILSTGFQQYAGKVAKDMFMAAVDKGISLLPGQWQAELIYEHQQKMGTFIDSLFATLDPKRLVNTIVNGTPAQMAELETTISRGVEENALRLGVPKDILDGDEPAYLVKLLHGEKISSGEAWGIVKGRVYSAGIEKATGRLLFGGD